MDDADDVQSHVSEVTSHSTKLLCESIGTKLDSSFQSSAPSVSFLPADFEDMKKLGIPVLDQPSSWDHSFAPAPNGELVREPSIPQPLRAAGRFTGTHGSRGLTSLKMSAACLDNSKVLGSSLGLGETLSAEDAVHGQTLTWVRGESLGSGSMGSVFKGLDQKTGEIVAVKEVRINEDHTSDVKFMTALQNEISILKELRHPQIVSFLGFDKVESRLYVYLDYMPGGSLAQVLLDFGALDECLAATYTEDIVNGLQYLHSRQPPVVHRDVKGANILVGLDCRVKLSDFGCSRRDEDKSGSIRGSIPWMAPEVIMQNSCGRPADIWSLGCVVIEMITAKAPWGGFDNHMAAMYKIGMGTDNIPIPNFLSSDGQDFVQKCTTRDPTNRSTAQDLLDHSFLGALVESLLD